MDLSQRQIDIIEAATTLIGEKGVQNLTTKRLAAKMGFSEPALYRHFKNKTEILKSVLLYYKQKLKSALQVILGKESLGSEKVKAMMEFQFGYFQKTPAIIMVIFAETSFQYDSDLSQVVSQIMLQKGEMVARIVQQGQEQGNIRSDIQAKQLVTMIMGSMRFTVLRWRLSQYSFDLVEEGKLLWTTIQLLIKKD